MTTIKIVHGDEQLLCDEKVQEWIRAAGDVTVEKYDMRETKISEIILATNQLGLFDTNEKYFVLNDAYFLGSEKGLSDKESEELLSLVNDSGNNSLIIIKYPKLDKRKKIVKTLIKAGEVFEGKQMKYPQSWIKSRAKLLNVKLENNVADKLFMDVGNDLYLLDSELRKLKLIYQQQVISVAMLEGVVSKTLESNVFALINQVMNKQASAMLLLDELLRVGNTPIQINLLVANQFRNLQMIKVGERLGKKAKEVLTMHPYALQIVTEQARGYSLSEIDAKLAEITELDLKMKRGQVESRIALETMLVAWM